MNDLNEQLVLIRRIHRWKMAFFGVIILIAGIVIGGASVVMFFKRFPLPRPGIEGIDEHAIGRLEQELSLTEEQSEQVREILNTHFQTLHRIRDEARPKVQKEIDLLHEKISNVLNESQKKDWDDHMKRLRSRIDEQLPPPPSPPR